MDTIVSPDILYNQRIIHFTGYYTRVDVDKLATTSASPPPSKVRILSIMISGL